MLDPVFERIRTRGGRITRPRVAILEALVEGPHHITVERLEERLRLTAPEVHETTLYRTLAALEELDIPGGHEIVLVVDGSPDNSLAVCQTLVAKAKIPITLIDHAFMRPWTVLKSYRRDRSEFPVAHEQDCAGDSANMQIGKELYYLSAEKQLMPTRKDQPPPDLRYFHQTAE